MPQYAQRLCSRCELRPEDRNNEKGLCGSCFMLRYFFCIECGGTTPLGEAETLYRRDGLYCSACAIVIAAERDERDDVDDEYSDDWGANGPRAYYRGGHPSKDALYQSGTLGDIVQSYRVFSAEIECYSPSGDALDNVFRDIPEGIGCTEDGSLDTGGFEFQTPQLRGKKGEEVLTTLCTALNKNEFAVNNSCGLHIHLDGSGLLPPTLTRHVPVALKQLWSFYLAYEPVIQSFLPDGRRSNTYCRKLAHVAKLDEIAKCKGQRDIERLWYKAQHPRHLDSAKEHHYHDSRYTGINFHSLLGSGHLEIRYHSGTLNAQKILHWVNLHTAILDRAALRMLPLEDSARASVLPLGEATAQMFKTLNLSQKTQDYLMRRQAKFADTKNKGEGALSDSETQTVCAA